VSRLCLVSALPSNSHRVSSAPLRAVRLLAVRGTNPSAAQPNNLTANSLMHGDWKDRRVFGQSRCLENFSTRTLLDNSFLYGLSKSAG
jgi:hypothetical protein